jgi:hypothetical protein
MKTLTILFCLLPSILINAQVIDWNNFNEKTLNQVLFSMLNEYTSLEGGYSISHPSSEHNKIYKFIKKNHEQLLLDDLSAKINEIIPVSSVGIIDSISCKDIIGYQEIVSRCIKDWTNSPSDGFFLIGWGTVVEVTSFYSNRTKSIYISCVFRN